MGASVVVVGGSLGGLRAAEQLRMAGHTGPITVVGDERHLPYNRPPLSKEILADPSELTPDAVHAKLAFRRRAVAADVDFLLGQAAVETDMARRRLTLTDGTTLPFDGLVVATGLRARRLSVPGPSSGRHVLRTIGDCVGLRAQLRPGCRVVVVGAGFIGCEAAATLARSGATVTVVEPAASPMDRVLGTRLGRAVQRHHEHAGIEFHTRSTVTGYAGTDTVTGVHVDGVGEIEADVVVEAVGSVPNTEWLAGVPGVDLSDGVLCDNHLRAVGVEAVVAVGDVARFPNPLIDDEPRRVEHWAMPTDTAKRAAATLHRELTGAPTDSDIFRPVPSFWSDQGDLRLQSFGSPALGDDVTIVEGDSDHLAAGLLATFHRRSRHVGTVAINLPPARQRELRDAFTGLVPVA